MFTRLWKCLILALCSTAGIACSHQRCSTCSGSMASPVASTEVPRVAASMKGVYSAAPIPVMSVKSCPGRAHTYVMVHPDCSSCQTAKGNPAPETAVAPRPLDPSVAMAKPAVLPPSRKVEVPARAAPETPKPGLVATAPNELRDPATGHVRYDHARDYSWVVGQLQYLHSKQQWRVRYSPYDVDDELGGAVTLVGVSHLGEGLQNGMSVRIQGQLVNPDSRKSSPEYQVYDLKMIQ